MKKRKGRVGRRGGAAAVTGGEGEREEEGGGRGRGRGGQGGWRKEELPSRQAKGAQNVEQTIEMKLLEGNN